jgi:hypothetical protein
MYSATGASMLMPWSESRDPGKRVIEEGLAKFIANAIYYSSNILFPGIMDHDSRLKKKIEDPNKNLEMQRQMSDRRPQGSAIGMVQGMT